MQNIHDLIGNLVCFARSLWLRRSQLPIMACPTPTSGGSEENSVGDLARFGVVTISDRASTGVYEDLSGPAILQFLSEAIKSR